MAPTYASVLLLGSAVELVSAVEELEAQIRPGVTAVCPKCDRVSLVAEDGSAGSVVHALLVWKCFGPFLDGVGQGARRKRRGRQRC